MQDIIYIGCDLYPDPTGYMELAISRERHRLRTTIILARKIKNAIRRLL